MAVKRISERFAFSGGKLGGTAEAPVVEAVLLCGAVSRNRRRYLREAFRGERVKRYDGVPVKVTVSHGDANGLYQEEIGIVTNPRHRDDGMPIGDIAVNPKKPYAEAFLWDAVHQPRACAMSHVAKCDTRRAADGCEEVTELLEAVSVDVIGAKHAATATTLFESEGNAVPTTLRSLIESALPGLSQERQKPAHKLLAEDDPVMGSMMDAPVADPADDASADDKIDQAFSDLMHAQLDALLADSHTFKEFVAKCRALYNTRSDVTGKGKAKADDGDSGGDGGDKKESVEVRMRESIAALKKAGGKGIDPDELELLMSVPAAVRESLAKKLFGQSGGAGAETPVSRQRRPVVAESKDKDGKVVESKDHPKQVTWGG